MDTNHKFQKVNDRFYCMHTNVARIFYTLEFGSRRIENRGKAWRLFQNGTGGRTCVACFTVEDDGHQCYKSDFGGCLWSFDELRKEATKLVNAMTTIDKSAETARKTSADISERIKTLAEEARTLFGKEDKKSEPPEANWLLRKALRIIESLVPDDQSEEESADKKAYKVHITEAFSRNVVIYADDESEACEIAEELCNGSIIDITSRDDFGYRNVEALGIATVDDKRSLRAYTSN